MNEAHLPTFIPPSWSLEELRSGIPPHVFKKNMLKSLYYLTRDVILLVGLWALCSSIQERITYEKFAASWTLGLRILVWFSYWWLQGLIFTGIWAIGHECGHSAFSDSRMLNNLVGYIVHTFLLTPYFSWKIVHHRHHMWHGSMERDEVYVPRTRSDLGIMEDSDTEHEDYFSDTPIYTFFELVRQQTIAFPVYLATNVSGQKKYPKWTNHFNPGAVFFTKEQRDAVILSDIGVAVMILLLYLATRSLGWTYVCMYYVVPYIALNNWIIMVTYLQHTDPHLPHYRGKAWNFQRGAAATVDRDFLGWWGRFFLHDVAHYHVIHHFFPKIPWYNAEEATKYLKVKLGNYYVRSNEPAFKTLWRNYNFCQFVDDSGDVVFYRNRFGRAVRRVAAH